MLQRNCYEEIYRNISRRIAEIRVEKGLSQEQLAAIIGIEPRNLQRWETKARVNLPNLIRFSKVLKCPIADFFQPSTTKPSSPGRPKKYFKNNNLTSENPNSFRQFPTKRSSRGRQHIPVTAQKFSLVCFKPNEICQQIIRQFLIFRLCKHFVISRMPYNTTPGRRQ